MATLQSVKVSVRLDNGTDSDGNQKYVSTGLGSLSPTGYTDEKAKAVVTALNGGILSKDVLDALKTETSSIMED